MSKPVDHQARETALDPTRSFAVAAPAGSGKTELLTQRVLRLLPTCQQPEEIVCITFTRKAAGEMAARITDALLAGSTTPEPTDEHKRKTWRLAQAVLQRDEELGWGLLQNPSRLRITTIDGFCRNLAQQMPLESGLGGAAETLDQPYMAYQKAARNLFRQLESEDEALAGAVAILFSHLDNNLTRIEGLLCGMLGSRDQWLPKIYAAKSGDARDYLSGVLQRVTEEALQTLLERLQPVASDMASVMDYAGTHMAQTDPGSSIARCAGSTGLPQVSVDALEHWKGVAALFLTGTGGLRKTVNVKTGFPAGTSKEEKAVAKQRKGAHAGVIDALRAISGIEADLHAVNTLPSPHYADADWELVGALTAVLPVLAAELDLVFKELGATDFTAITLGAITALGQDEEYSDLTLKMDHAISHILMDEFQDTASPQLHLLQRLTEGWEPNDGRTLFVVGDGMQSIYGFRDANVGIFLGVRGGSLPNIAITPLDLTVNFRSQAAVVHWVNENFLHAFPESANISRGAVPYSPSDPFNAALSGAAVSCHALVDAPDRVAEAQKVVELIQQAKAEDPEQTIAILVRTRPQLKDILEALRQANLKWQATDIASLASRQSIIDLMTMTRVLLSPTDRLAWLAFLRAPWVGLTLNDLHTLANAEIPQNPPLSDGYPLLLNQLRYFREIDALSDFAKQVLSRIVPLLLGAWDTRRRKTLRATVEGLWLALGGPSALAQPSDMEDIKTYLNLLDSHEEAGLLEDWAEFEKAVEKLYAAPDPDADPKLQVMSLHKSKGLEFDVCIMPGLDKGSRSDDKQLMLWQEWIANDGSEHLMMATLGATGKDDAPAYKFLAEESRIKTKLESTRLLYVGATRAVKRLHLIANVVSDPKKDGIKAPSSGSLLSCIWDGFSAQMQETTCAGATPGAAAERPVLDTILRLPQDWQAPVMEEDKTLSRYRGEEMDDGGNNIPSPESFYARDARLIGTATHRLLCQVGKSGVDSWDSARVDAMDRAVRAQLLQSGVSRGHLKDAVTRVLTAVKRTLEDDVGRWILDNTHRESAFELPLCTWRKDDVTTHIIDRTFIDSEGIRWIIDYKSSEYLGDDLEAFIQAEEKAYRSQLTRYRTLFKDQGESSIKCSLYFPNLSLMHEVKML